jgi:putative SOS response-associated peptidase YedK
LPISWNIAPTQDVLAIRLHPETKQRSLDALRWGLIPNWAKDPKIANKTINARAETIDTAPSYRQAFKRRRCLVPADGFFEWKKVPGGKIPYSIGTKDNSPFVFAGLWEASKVRANDEWLHGMGECTKGRAALSSLVQSMTTTKQCVSDRALCVGRSCP